MTHPLTDDIAESIAVTDLQCPFGIGELVFTHADMRRAADWQLEQDSEAWKIILNRMKILHPLIVDSIIEEFKKAMRPQEDS